MGRSITDFAKGARFYSLAISTQVALSNLGVSAQNIPEEN